MTAAEAVQLGPVGFNAWIDAQVHPVSRRERRKARTGAVRRRSTMARFWWLSQPLIGYVRKHPAHVAGVVSAVSVVMGLVMLWKAYTR